MRLILATVLTTVLFGCGHAPKETEVVYLSPTNQMGQTKAEADQNLVGRYVAGKPSSFDVSPKILYAPAPNYPNSVKRANIVGQVDVRFSVNVDGSVGEIEFRNHPPTLLAELVRTQIEKWRFEPAMKAGVATKVRVQQTFKFALE